MLRPEPVPGEKLGEAGNRHIHSFTFASTQEADTEGMSMLKTTV